MKQQQLQVQNSHGPQPQALTNLQKFIQNYNKFIVENPSIEFNSNTIINDIANNILKPPISRSNNNIENDDLYNLYIKGKSLSQTLDPKEGYIHQTVNRLKKLKQDKVYQTIMFIQQLNYRLNKQYQEQVKKGIINGVYDQKNTAGSHQNIKESNNGSNSNIKFYQKNMNLFLYKNQSFIQLIFSYQIFTFLFKLK